MAVNGIRVRLDNLLLHGDALQSDKGTGKDATSIQKLKQAIQDYGPVVVVFHVGISLVSLGIFYTAIDYGIDLPANFKKLGLLSESDYQSMAAGASTFVVAYAVHKLFAPVRIGITLTSVPFIVRKLRKVGFIRQRK